MGEGRQLSGLRFIGYQITGWRDPNVPEIYKFKSMVVLVKSMKEQLRGWGRIEWADILSYNNLKSMMASVRVLYENVERALGSGELANQARGRGSVLQSS